MKGILMIFVCFYIVSRLTASESIFGVDFDDYDLIEDETVTDDVMDTNNLICNYDTTTYTSVGSVYRCNLQNNINIISRGSAMMLSASGTHLENKSNGYVTAFSSTSSSQIINYIPMNLENIFPNLTSIHIDYGRVKELQQSDLRPYPKLMYLYLDNNDIEVLEDGLFAYNLQMVYIRIDDNKIFHIGAHVFDHLNKLVSLDLENNKCISMYCSNTATAVKEIISQTKVKCYNQEYASIDDRLKTLEDNLVCANSEAHPFFEQRLSSLKNQFRVSKVSTLALLSRRFEALSTWKSQNIGTILDKINTLEAVMDNISVNITTTHKKELDQKILEIIDKITTLEASIKNRVTAKEASINTRMTSMDAKISSLTSILQDFIQSSTRSSNQFQWELKDRLQITNYKIDKSSMIQDYSKSMLIGSCALLITLVLVIIYKKILIRPDDLDY